MPILLSPAINKDFGRELHRHKQNVQILDATWVFWGISHRVSHHPIQKRRPSQAFVTFKSMERKI